MQFLKANLFYIICGVVAVLGLAGGVVGMGKMSSVKENLGKAVMLHGSLSGLTNQPVNAEFIRAEENRIDQEKRNHDQIVDRARALATYEPLLPDVFPDGDREKRLAFRRAYRQAFNKVFAGGNYGTSATLEQVNAAKAEIRLEQKLGQDPDGEPTKPTVSPAGVLTQEGAMKDAVARANITLAQQHFCYYQPFEALDRASTLEFYPAMAVDDPLSAPTIQDCWAAQVSLWIQQDVVDAITRTNEQEAQRLTELGQNPWVAVLPVKEILSIRVHPYHITTSMVQPSNPDSGDGARVVKQGSSPIGRQPAGPVGSADVAWTGGASDAVFDVLQFTVKLVVDERDLPSIINEICRDRMHNLLRVSYVSVPPDPLMQGRIYGSEPTVNVVLDFETYMLGEVYRRWMPDVVLQAYGLQRPASQEEAVKG